MQFAIIAALAGMAVAAPTWGDKTTSSTPVATPTPTGSSNNGIQNQPACCNTDSNSQGGLIGGIADGLLGGSCTLVVAGSVCSPNQVSANCPTDAQTGLINIGSICLPITV